LDIDNRDGITVIAQIKEQATPNAPTRDNVRISVFAASFRKRNGTAPAIVVPVVASNTGILFLSAR